jgi:hypothetical protein
MKYCCEVFRSILNEGGKRGLSIIVVEANVGPVFFFQARSLDPERQLPSTGFVVTTELEVAIKFCPWCGANLKRKYGRNAADLARPELQLKTH